MVTLPGDCHSTAKRCFAMTEYFVRNITRVCLLERNSNIYVRTLCYSVQRTLCHCERSVAISRKGHLIIKSSRFCEGFLGFILSRRLRFVRLRLVRPMAGFVRFLGYFVPFRSARPFSFCGLSAFQVSGKAGCSRKLCQALSRLPRLSGRLSTS